MRVVEHTPTNTSTNFSFLSLAYFTCANKYASERESDRSWMSGGGHSLPRTYGTAGVPKRDS